MRLFVIALIVLEVMVGFMVLLAAGDGSFWLHQMRRRARQGLPFSNHGGMWGNAFLVAPLAAGIIAIYAPSWSWSKVVVWMGVGALGSFLVNEGYKKGVTWVDSLVWDGGLTSAGEVLRVFMAVVIATFGLYFVHAPYTRWMWAVSAVLIVYATVANHVVLRLMEPAWFPKSQFALGGMWYAIIGVATATFGITGLRTLRVW